MYIFSTLTACFSFIDMKCNISCTNISHRIPLFVFLSENAYFSVKHNDLSIEFHLRARKYSHYFVRMIKLRLSSCNVSACYTLKLWCFTTVLNPAVTIHQTLDRSEWMLLYWRQSSFGDRCFQSHHLLISILCYWPLKQNNWKTPISKSDYFTV